MKNREKNFVSAILYLHNDGPRAAEFCRALNAALDEHFEQYELIAVDDACTGDTVPALRTWAKTQEKPLTILHLSVHQGRELAMNAGLDAAIGDYVYEFDTTRVLEDPAWDPALVFAAYQKALEGSDIVSVCPHGTSGSSALFYRLFNANSQSVYKLRTDAFRLVTRRAINRVHASSAYLPYRKAAYAASGLAMAELEYPGRLDGEGAGRLGLAFDSLALYTEAGFRVSAGLTLTMMTVALLELVYTVTVFLTGQPIEGWTTTMFVLTFGFAGLFAVLTIVIKYLSLLVDLTFRKQKYLIESVEKLQK